MINNYSYLFIFLPSIVLCSTSASLSFKGFVEYPSSDAYQNATAINITPKCPYLTCPKIAFTIEPSPENNTVIVSSLPANVVEVYVGQGNLLQFTFTDLSQQNPNATGVRVQFPSAQLLGVNVTEGNSAQIIDGFPNIAHINVDDSSLYANMTNLTTSINLNLRGAIVECDIGTNTSAMISLIDSSNLQLKGYIVDGVIDSKSVALIEGMVDKVRLTGGATLNINGNGCGNVTIDLYAGTCNEVEEVVVVEQQPVVFTSSDATSSGGLRHELGRGGLVLFSVIGVCLLF